jgi:DNA-binding LacI/PurR family transcriptional regulator
MARERKTTKLQDIAEEVGMSINTVSRALRNKPDVNETTRNLIVQKARAMGYEFTEPAPISRDNILQIGVLIEDMDNPYFTKIIRGIEQVFWHERQNFIAYSSYRQESKELSLCEFFCHQRLDGIIVASAMNPPAVVDCIEKHDIPAVALSRNYEEFGMDFVATDNFAGGLMATEHLVRLGHTAIAHISGVETQRSAIDRIRGYKQALADAGIPIDSRLIRVSDNSIESGYYLTRDLLQISDRPTAIFAYNDLVALGCYRAITECGLTIPTDISVVGFDDIAFAEYYQQPLTTVIQPTVEIGIKAAEILIHKIQNPPFAEQKKLVLKPLLAVRSSTSICPRK